MMRNMIVWFAGMLGRREKPVFSGDGPEQDNTHYNWIWLYRPEYPNRSNR
jgi:hypothetical protein